MSLILITGCARSATKYTSRVLCERLGLDVPHEAVGKHGLVSWHMAVKEAQSSPAGICPKRVWQDVTMVVHQVRHPLKCIASCMTLGRPSWEYICEHSPCAMEMPVMERAANYWYWWNARIESLKPDIRVRIESLPRVDFGPKMVNARHHRSIDWHEIPGSVLSRIVEMTKRYGYEAVP